MPAAHQNYGDLSLDVREMSAVCSVVMNKRVSA